MAQIGTITVTTTGYAVAFSTGNPQFRATSFVIENLNSAGNGSFQLDLTTTFP